MKKIKLFLLFIIISSSSLLTQAHASPYGSHAKNPPQRTANSCGNNAKACFSAALNAREQRNMLGAAQLFAKACNLGMTRACAAAGDTYSEVPDYRNAEKYLVLSCNKGNAVGCSVLGSFYLDKIKPANPKKGLLYKTKACHGGNIGSCAVAGTLYAERSLYRQAKPLLEKACYNRKDKVAIASGCNGLANLYSSGLVVSKNRQKALQLYKRGCDTRTAFSGPACENYQFQSRNYTPYERQQAEVACNNMNLLSCHRLALIYLKGKGVTINLDKAMSYVKKACSGGDQRSCESYQVYITPAPSVSSSSSSSNGYTNGGSSTPQQSCGIEYYTKRADGTGRIVQTSRWRCSN